MTRIAVDDFPASDEDAAGRFEKTKSADPFPEIEPALLNTADVLDYINATGMIHPFDVDPDRSEKVLKPASCAIPVGGKWLYWPPDDKADHKGCSGKLHEGEELWLEPNSIVYVTLAPRFRIPDYIAARYNLRIKHIYQGILVGTGPLVDPGFNGYLSVPLHNLTSNLYRIIGGEPLVWMEFTKLSSNERWTSNTESGRERKGNYVAFPSHKLQRDGVGAYVRYAHDGPIRSSIPEETQRASQAAELAEGEVRKFRKWSFWGAAAVAVAIVALTYQAVSFVGGAMSEQGALSRDVAELRHELSSQREALRLCSADGDSMRTACIQRTLRKRAP